MLLSSLALAATLQACAAGTHPERLCARLSAPTPASAVIGSLRASETKITEGSTQTSRVSSWKNGSGELLEIREEGSDHIFGVIVRIKNLDTGKEMEYQTRKHGQKLPRLIPGKYRLLTEASRLGFPQEVRYDVLQARTNRVIEAFPLSHVGVSNILIEKGQKLRVTIVPSVRPYNSVFYKIGPDAVPGAHLFTRPYPSQDFAPGEFNGDEQFSAAPIGMAFWGEKLSRENPQLAEEIRTKGVATLRAGERIYDPVLVLGARHVAEDLAKAFVEHRKENGEDYRGKFHTTFLVLRTRNGKVPLSLKKMQEAELALIFEKQLTWMMRHNVHRPAEGGGYAGKTFEQDLQEGRDKLKDWPGISRESTEGYSNDPETWASSAELRKLILAIHRERQNYQTYDAETLAALENETGEKTQDRLRNLQELMKKSLERMKILDESRLKELEQYR